MMPPTSIDGTDITGATIDGTDVQEITVDGQTVFTAAQLPDTGLLHNFDARELSSATTFTDQKGSADLTAQGSPSLNASGINGNQTVSLDGANDYYEGPLSASQPVDVFLVMQKTTADAGIYSTNQGGAHPRFTDSGSDALQIDAGNQISSGITLTSPEIFLTGFDGGNSVFHISDKNTPVASGNAGTDDFGGTFYIGVNTADNFHLESEFGHILFYDASASGYSRSDVWDYLSNEWGISV